MPKVKLLIIFLLCLQIKVYSSAKYDTSLGCNVCHFDSKYKMHPMSMAGSGLKTTLPLSNNTITCQTCHTNHTDDPLARNKPDTTLTFLLRIPNIPVSSLCVNCHDGQKFLIGTEHDLKVTAPNAVNSLEKTTARMGPCSACHLVHNGMEIKLWSREVGLDTDIISMFCKGCHNDKGNAKSKSLSKFNHIMETEVIQKGLTTTLPLYNEKAKVVLDGRITCSTCHDVHVWSPDEKKQGSNKNEEGTGANNFLRINNQRNAELCVNCHKIKGLILGSAHDLVEGAFNEKNILNKTPGDSGTCSACHLVHNGKDKENFAREYGQGVEIIAQKCTSCHMAEKIAEKKLTGEISHSINIPISSKINTRLPLFDRDGKKNYKGTIKCTTCHNVHEWSPDRTKLHEIKKEEVKINKSMIQKGLIGVIVHTKDATVYIDQTNDKIQVKKDDILSVFRESESAIIGRLKVKNVNPFAKESEIFATIITEESIGKLNKGDIIFNPRLLDISLGGGVTGDGTNSFLNIINNNSELCIDCHKNKSSIFNTKHDLTIKFPKYTNYLGQKVLSSGQCSACHAIHNAKGPFLVALPPKEGAQNIDNLSKTCNICHFTNGVANNKILSLHHAVKLFPPKLMELTPPPTFMPLFDLEGNVGFWDYVSCSTCHDVHQWDPDNPKKQEIVEGDDTNSFLRIKNNERDLCNACHVNSVNLNMVQENKKKEENKSNPSNAANIDDLNNQAIIISEGGPKIEITQPKNKILFSSYEQTISGNIDNTTVSRAQVLINGKPVVISVSGGMFSEKIILNEGKNNIKILATSLDGKSGISNEIVCFVDTRKPKILGYEYPKPVGLMDDFIIKIIFDQPMDPIIMPFIYFVTSDKRTIVPELQVTSQITFYSIFEDAPRFDNQTFNELKQNELLLNSKEFRGYGNKPQILIKDPVRDKKFGAGNDQVIIIATSPQEPKGEIFTIKETESFPGVFLGEIEFGRWEEYGDKMIAADDKEKITITYNLAEYSSTYQEHDTFVTTPINITREMKGAVRIVIENAKSYNGNIIDRNDTESFIVNPDVFYVRNKIPIIIQEGELTRTQNIHLNFFVDDAIEMIFSEDPGFSLSKWETYEKEKEYLLGNQGGIKNIYCKFKNKFKAESQVFNLKIRYIPIEYKVILDKDISKNMVLTEFMGPYLINKSFTVLPGATLQIEEGTKIWIDANAKEKIKITILGKLIAQGNEDKKINFTSNSIKPNQNDWDGIEIINSNDNQIKYVDIEYANQALVINGSSGNIENCKFQDNNYGLICDNANPNINLNEFKENKIGLLAKEQSCPNITNNYFSYNEIGIICDSVSSPKIVMNAIVKNTNTGIKCLEMASPPISDNNISQNIEYGIYISKASPMIYQNNITENMFGIYIENFHAPFMIRNNNIHSNKEYSIKLSKFTQSFDVSKNWWGVKNTDIIKKIIFDYDKDKSLGKLVFFPILEGPITSRNISTTIDKEKPIIVSTEYRNPANITNHFQISFVFNESLNPYILPKIILEKQSGELVTVPQGIFSSISLENDTYITPEIILDESFITEVKSQEPGVRSQKINIFIENIQDLTGNLADKFLAGSFIFDPTLKVKEGDFLSNRSITLEIKAQEASEMIISETSNLTEKSWEQFQSPKNINLSEKEGKKTIYVRTRTKTGILSLISQFILNYDATPPRIINQIYNVPKVDEAFTLKLYFNEPLNLTCTPKITMRSTNKNEFVLPQGKILSTNFMNDTYLLPSIMLPKNIEGYISVIVEDVIDRAGNKIDPTAMNNLFRFDIVPPSPLVKVEDGNHTQKNDIILIFEEQKDRSGVEMILSEDKEFKNANWEPLKKERGFVLSNNEGEKNIFLKFKDKVGYTSEIQKITVFIDRTPPKILNYKYPKPAKISNDFQINVQFNESLDTTFIPELNLVSTGKIAPTVSGKGTFISTTFPNDTYVSPPIVLNEDMGGALTIIMVNVYDIAKNKIELEMKESFNFDTYAPVATDIIAKEGNYVRNPKINFKLSVIGAAKMMISEDIEFKNLKWEKYIDEKEYIMSDLDGIKKIYFKFEKENGNISKPQRIEITLDRVKPQITKFDFPEKVEFNKPFKITMHFSEEVEPNKPAIVLMSTSRINYLIANDGTFISDKTKNDTYVTPEIILDDSMKGAIVIFVDQVFDPTGNRMDGAANKLFFFGEEDPRNKKISIKGGDYTRDENITILFNYQDVKKIRISEDPNFKIGTWVNYKEKIKYKLSGLIVEKKLYISLLHNDDKIENQNIKVYLDKIAPEILKTEFPSEDAELVDQIKVVFNETLDKNYPLSIIITDRKGNNILLPEKGTFVTTNKKHDTYITPVISKFSGLVFPIRISVTKAQDLAGNIMKLIHVEKRAK